jgi:hypothetical protein
MVIRLFSFIAIMLFSCVSCEKKLYELSMAKTPYTGNELRIDGYYYSNPTTENNIGIAVFYRDGVCMHLFERPESQDTLDFIENEILLNNTLMSRLWSTPSNIGVFQINEKSIEFETWIAGRDITTFSHFGEILNGTTFLLTKWTNNDQGKSYSVNLTYRFKQFSPKPDSTNNFVK